MTTKTNRIPNHLRWEKNLAALEQFVARENHARVPATHIELLDGQNIPLGAWVGYMRQRQRAGLLPNERRIALEEMKGWEWGPLRPGPSGNSDRDGRIFELRSANKSLQEIAEEVGLSRQRIHQIIKRAGK